MSGIPFTSEQFRGVFTAYNQAVWPAPLVLNALAVILVWFAARPSRYSSKVIWLGLAGLWLWSGILYHLVHFAEINPAAFGFAALFVAQALLFARASRKDTNIAVSDDAFGKIGAALIIYAILLYPGVGMIAGARYPAVPTFGAPCPVTIFTFAMLFWTRRDLPMHLLVIPAIWALLGVFAVVAFGVIEDAVMPLAALAAVSLLWRRHRTQRLVTLATLNARVI